MKKLEGFALRLPPEVKAAAVALSKAPSIFEMVEEEGQESWYGTYGTGGSINDALNSLLLRGIASSSKIVSTYLKHQRDECVPWKDIAKFFLDNPAASYAFPVNFDADSAARKLIQRDIESWVESNPDIDPADIPEGMDRQTAMAGLASLESEIWRLTEALGALQKAAR